jgi:hypothetical protein
MAPSKISFYHFEGRVTTQQLISSRLSSSLEPCEDFGGKIKSIKNKIKSKRIKQKHLKRLIQFKENQFF